MTEETVKRFRFRITVVKTMVYEVESSSEEVARAQALIAAEGGLTRAAAQRTQFMSRDSTISKVEPLT